MTQREALDILKTGANVFLTGEPGAGKTHTISEYAAYLRGRGIEPSITASTGIAATHIGGMTIHSWSGIGVRERLNEYDLDKISSSEYVVKRVRRAKVLIIDEVSMLSAETLSMVDAVCREIRRNSMPFGGLQIIFVGDFFQLPPIQKYNREEDDAGVTVLGSLSSLEVKRFAYDSEAWARANVIISYLTEQHRQDDENFLSVLSSIRRNAMNQSHMRHMENRKISEKNSPKGAPKLFSHNIDVDRVNDETLAKISGPPKIFEMSSRGPDFLVNTLKKGCLSPEKLALKIGAAVMFTKNNLREGFVNGTLGEVTGFGGENGYPLVKTRGGRTILAEPMDFTVEEGGTIRARVTQIPLRLAWAITVHKSQGMSLDEAVMDLSQVFEFGQGYVALSRVRRLSGLHLLGWNKRTFEVHPEVLKKDEWFKQASVGAGRAFQEMDARELLKMHGDFLSACGGKKDEVRRKIKESKNLRSLKPKIKKGPTTFETTLALFEEGYNVAEISKQRILAETTIVAHLEKLFVEGKIEKKEIIRVIPARTRVDMEKIAIAFKENEGDKLQPVFEKFAGRYPYEDLRLVRMVI